jgi:hypothetical protein
MEISMDQWDQGRKSQQSETEVDAPEPEQEQTHPVRTRQPQRITFILLPMAGLLIVTAAGPEEPTRASVPFHIAANGAKPAGVEVAVALAGDAAELVKPDVIANVLGVGLPPLRELLDKCLDQNVRVYV